MQLFGLTYSCGFETKPREPALKPLGATTWLDNRFLPDSRSVKTGQVTGQGLTPDLMDLADLTERQAQSSKVKRRQPNGANYWCKAALHTYLSHHRTTSRKKSEIQEIHVVITAAPFSSLQPCNSLWASFRGNRKNVCSMLDDRFVPSRLVIKTYVRLSPLDLWS